MADTFGFDSNGDSSEDELEAFGRTDGHSDIEPGDSDSWSSDDEASLADLVPLAALGQQEPRRTCQLQSPSFLFGLFGLLRLAP